MKDDRVTHVSVIMISHNASRFIREAIDSVLNQSHPVAQLIVVDDSSDQSPQIVREYADRHPEIVELVVIKPCRIPVARNVGLDRVTGDVLSFLDADDVWLPHKTRVHLNALTEHPDAVAVFSPYFDFVQNLDDCRRRVPKPGRDDPSVRDILMEQNMASSTVTIRRSAIGDLRFDEQSHCEDVLFVADLRLKGPWRRIEQPLIGKRIHADQASRIAWHQVRNYDSRMQWCRSRQSQIGDEMTQKLLDELGSAFVQLLEGLYWRRDLKDLKRMCHEAKRMCPQAFEQSFLSRTRIMPRWIYLMRDLVR